MMKLFKEYDAYCRHALINPIITWKTWKKEEKSLKIAEIKIGIGFKNDVTITCLG